MLEIIIIYLLLGVTAGVIAGLLGIGGGVVIVPALVLVFQSLAFPSQHIMHLALGSSLATIVITAIAAVYAHHRNQSVNWRIFFWMAPGLAVGAVLGALFADTIDSHNLQRLFGLFEIVVAVYMVKGRKQREVVDFSLKPLELIGAGSGIGGVSSLLGIGGGTMSVPYLTWRGLDMKQAVALSSACGFPIALAGAFGYLYAGLDSMNELPEMSLGYLYLPAIFCISLGSTPGTQLGARLVRHLPVVRLKQIFAVLLASLGIYMVITS